MNQALVRNVITDRVVLQACTDEQRLRHTQGLLTDAEFREAARLVLFHGILDLPACKRICHLDYKVPEDDFKVLERQGRHEVLSAEQAQSLREVQDLCAVAPPRAPAGLLVTRGAVFVEKFVVSAGRTLATVPLALVTVEVSDPQGRAPALGFTRRVAL